MLPTVAWDGEEDSESLWCDGGVRAHLPDGVWSALGSRGRHRVYEAGDVLVRQGEAGARVVVLLDGLVKATRCDEYGTDVLLAIRGSGEVIGEMAVIDDGASSTTVSALVRCGTRVLSAEEFMAFVLANNLTLPLLRHAAARRRESERICVELSTLSVSRRLVRMLLRLVQAMGTHAGDAIALDIGMPQEELARAIGASRSQVAADLARLRAEGILSTGRRRVLVRDAARLRAMDAQCSPAA
jgi:CRP/FNR family transcriptional regulator, cyclic AMP receptor protein